MSSSAHAEYAVVLLAPFGRDAASACDVLAAHGICAEIVQTPAELCVRLLQPLGALVMAEEALSRESVQQLREALSHQQPWSNLPTLLLTARKPRFFSTEDIIEAFGTAGSITLLERPFRVLTLVTAVRGALQNRKRQYEVRSLLEEQARAVQKQREAVRQRDDFLSMASHELKTPLTSMKLQVQIRKRLQESKDPHAYDAAKAQSLLRFMETQIKRMVHLVDDMLDVSRIENGKLTLNLEPLELGALVSEVLEGFLVQFETAGCAVDFQVETPAHGNWDQYRIEQVVANLFTNVLKYGAGKPVQIRVRAEGDRAQVVVRDQGMGIAPENLERIFRLFERAVAGINLSGLGLGLFITRQILELHGGAVRVESELGAGSTFTAELPLLAPAATPA